MSVDFDLSEDQRHFQSAVEALLADLCTPQQLLTTFDTPAMDAATWQGLQALGVPGMMIPEAHGGLGLQALDAAVVAEVMGRFAAPAAFAEHVVGGAAIVEGGGEALRERWLPPLAAGKARITASFLEGGEAWAPDSWTVAAGPRISAVRPHVPWSDGMDLLLVGLAGGRLGVVEVDTPGVTVEPAAAFDPTHRLATVRLDNVPCTVLGGDLALAWRLFDLWSLLLAADAVGGAQRCLRETVAFVQERVQFGVPVGRFQAVKHQLAELALQIEPLAGLYWYAAHGWDNHLTDSAIAAARAKAHSSEVYANSVRRSIELHGGVGYTWEFGTHIWLRRSIFDRQFLGTPARHRARLAELSGW
ncbi:acyl-CoA dehydrogenase family protein [Sphingomonas flavalba]|uniref:acyl-CoA dehydrogenase family protein n=1 Tax=Sphingomonas flavalba TaxID=2559804 RepID=UPI0039E0F8C5